MGFFKKLFKGVKKVGKVVAKGASIVGSLAKATNIPLVSNIGGLLEKGGAMAAKLIPGERKKAPSSAVVEKLVANPVSGGLGGGGNFTPQAQTAFAMQSGASFTSGGFDDTLGKIFGSRQKPGWFWPAVIGGPVLLITLLVLIFKTKKRR